MTGRPPDRCSPSLGTQICYPWDHKLRRKIRGQAFCGVALMRRTKVVLILLAACLLGMSGCKEPLRGPYCQGWVFVDWPMPQDPQGLPQSEYGELRCNGRCPDGSACTSQHQEFENPVGGIIRREWCACPDETEPQHCHGVRELYVVGERRIWRFNSRGNCPVVDVDFCREVWRQTDPPQGVDKRYVAQCECLPRQ